ncbi:Adenylate cyclase [Desulfurella amilsii]|uniref:Adenylate cyclase n=1 Tax=Desulfurella amilsii TaxID=1562698 RepID=A0A1X4XXR0_9BACT|nr:CHAD domain-containing protein [Desulfurella amilsii]OSS42316.1 Adenylate cyclase [Desulfurella amilsii]
MLLYEELDKTILYQLSEIESNFKDLYSKKDAVHDLRVSIRRFFSYIVCLKKYLNIDPKILYSTRFFLKSSNKLRDTETLIEKINLLEPFEYDLKPLMEYLLNEHNQQKLNFQNMLNIYLPDFLLQTRNIIEQKTHHKEKYMNTTFKEALQKALYKQSKKIKKIEPQKNNLHKLRIEYKKYRYILEIFDKVYPESKALEAISKLKWLQDKLGYVQDLNTHISYLQSLKILSLSDTIDALIKTFKSILKQNRKNIILALSFFRFFQISWYHND